MSLCLRLVSLTGLVQRCVIIQKDENGFGLTVSGDNPVFVQLVKEGEAKKNPNKQSSKNRERRQRPRTRQPGFLLTTLKGDAILPVVNCQLGCNRKGSSNPGTPFEKC